MTSLPPFIPPVIAHRGASGYAPENTMAAFTKAIQLGARWIEFDVMLAACQTPIVFHDDDLQRTTNGTGRVDSYPYTYLETLDAGRWFNPCFSGETIPRLSQVINFTLDHKICANLELKPLPNQDEITTHRIWHDVIERYPECLSSVLFSSFSLPALIALRKLSATCSIGLLMENGLPDWQAYCRDLHCYSLNVSEAWLTQEKANIIKSQGLKLLCYTVNDARRANELFSWGVDAVFSDYPDIISRGLTLNRENLCYNI